MSDDQVPSSESEPPEAEVPEPSESSEQCEAQDTPKPRFDIGAHIREHAPKHPEAMRILR